MSLHASPSGHPPVARLQSLSFAYPGGSPVLRNLSLSVHPGEVVALAGTNGSGKSTLLSCLVGDLQPLTGSAHRGSIAFLAQQDAADHGDEASPPDRSSEFTRNLDLTRRLWRHHPAFGPLVARLQADDWEALAEFGERGGYAYEQRLREHCEQFGVPTELASAVPDEQEHGVGWRGVLSPGQRQLLELAALFASDADLLVLDEPSNHLDADAAEVLESAILRAVQAGCGVLLVSHDRHLIDAVASRTAWLDDGELSVVSGGWAACAAHRAERAAGRAHDARQIKRRIGQLEDEVRQRTAWSQRKEASKRGAGALKPHIAKQAKKMARRAQDKQKRLDAEIERLRERAPRRQRVNRLASEQHPVARRAVAELRSVAFRYDAQSPWLLHDVDLHLDTASRIAVAGPNGGGKSTLLSLVAGDLEPVGGELLRYGTTASSPSPDGVVVARLRQDLDDLFHEATLLDGLRAELPLDRWDESEVRTHLATVGLRRERALVPSEELSHGERMRAALALMILQRPDFLILDEPSNHLDIEMIEVLERVLLEFPGGFLLVSHDRRLIDTVAEQTLELRSGRLAPE